MADNLTTVKHDG